MKIRLSRHPRWTFVAYASAALTGQDYSNLLQPGRPLAATGFGTVNSYGKSLEATTLACSGSQPQTVPTVAPPLQARP